MLTRTSESPRMNAATALLIGALGICAAGLLLPLPLFLKIALGLPLVFYLPGIATMTALGLRGSVREDRIFLPLILSPIVMSLAMLLLYPATGSVLLSMRFAVLLFLALLAAISLGRRSDAPGPAERLPREIYLISILFCLLLVISFLANPYLLVRSDSYFHASVINEIKVHGIPPMDPRLPDIPIKYYWMYHFFLLGWMQLTGLPIFWTLFSFMLVNAFVFPYLMARFAHVFTKDRAKIIATPLFALAGLGAAAWILCPPIILIRSFVGDVTGLAELKRNLAVFEWNSHRVIYTLTPPGTSLTNVLDKYFTLTSYTYSISLFFFCTIAVLDSGAFARGRIRYALFLLVIFAGNFLFQILTGMALIMIAVGSAALFALLFLMRRSFPPAYQSLIVPGVAILSAIAVIPYVRSLGSTAESGGIRQFIHIGTYNLTSMLAPCIATIPFSYRAIRKLLGARSEADRFIAVWIASGFFVAVFFNAGGMAEVKLAFFFLQLLLPFIAWEFIDAFRQWTRGRRVALALWIAVLFVVPAALTVRGFLLDQPASAEEEHPSALNRAEIELVDWIRNNTPPDAVVMEHAAYNIMPVYADRRSFYSLHSSLVTFGYDDAKTARYRDTYFNVFSPEPLKRENIENLRGCGFDLYIVLWDLDLSARPEIASKLDAAPEDFERVFRSPAGIVYRFKR